MNVQHRGALGDILYSWFWLHKSGSIANYYVPATGGFSPHHDSINQYLALKDLADRQPYLSSFTMANNYPGECDDLRWYVDGGAPTESPTIIKPYFKGHQVAWQGHEPWIFGVGRPVHSNDYSVLNITARYRDPKHEWNRYLPAGVMKFVGLQQEYDEFRHYLLTTGYEDAAARLIYVPTSNLLEAAYIIAGAKAFFGNASSCLALAQGLGKPCYVEVGQGTQNTCLFGHEKILNEV